MDNWGEYHGILMTTAWFGCENLLLWSTLLKNFRFGIYLHAFFATVCAGFMVVAIMMTFSEDGD